jgi:RecQ family ATP-dependent DNA helicase
MRRAPLRRESSITDLRFTLRRVFGKDAFRPLQEDVINAVMGGHDVFLCAATSFGKSLCYQLPAVVSLGVTVVVSPLLALMQNQVEAARNLGIAVECINGKTSYHERARIETDLLCGHPATKLLYVTPELCATDNFRRLVLKIHRQGQLARVAIDEAHCISEWGHDFRPTYKELIWLKTTLNCPAVAVMAVTATATRQVRQDIFRFLGLTEAATRSFSTTTARPNIHYEVQYFSESHPHNGEDDIFPHLFSRLEVMHQRRLTRARQLSERDSSSLPPPISGIIYVSSRAKADNLACRLTHAGIRAHPYHAGLDGEKRSQIQTTFLRYATGDPRPVSAPTDNTLMSSFNVICATTAFGMGIDVPTIRFVIHYGLPKGMEAFTQESGRAGRDGKAASSVVLYTREDKERAEFRVSSDLSREKAATAKGESRMHSLKSIVDFCETTDVCRHALVSRYFGDSVAGSGADCSFACDVCKEGPAKLKKRKERGLATEAEAFEYTQREPMTNYEYE